MRGWTQPLFVLPNGGGLAYGRIVLDRTSLVWLVAHLPEVHDPLTRGSAWVTLWDELLDRGLAPPRCSISRCARCRSKTTS